MNTFTIVFLIALIISSSIQFWLAKRHAEHVAAHRSAVPDAFKAKVPLAAHQKAADYTLAKIVGSTPLPRSELTKKIWDYIKKNKLQDEKKRTLINADDALKAVFGGKKQVTMFEMTKHVSGHVK